MRHMWFLTNRDPHSHTTGQPLDLLSSLLVRGATKCPIHYDTECLLFVLWKLSKSMGPIFRFFKILLLRL